MISEVGGKCAITALPWPLFDLLHQISKLNVHLPIQMNMVNIVYSQYFHYKASDVTTLWKEKDSSFNTEKQTHSTLYIDSLQFFWSAAVFVLLCTSGSPTTLSRTRVWTTSPNIHFQRPILLFTALWQSDDISAWVD